jgi:hypothetical protein
LGAKPGQGSLLAEAIAGLQAPQLFLLAATLHHPDLRAERFQPRFKEQRNHQNHHRRRLQALQFGLETSAHQGVHQLLQPLAFRRIGKHQACQGRAIHGGGAVTRLHRPAVTLEHRLGGRRSGRQGRASQLIGIHHRDAVPFGQHPSHGALPRGDASREPDPTYLAHPADQPMGPA